MKFSEAVISKNLDLDCWFWFPVIDAAQSLIFITASRIETGQRNEGALRENSICAQL